MQHSLVAILQACITGASRVILGAQKQREQQKYYLLTVLDGVHQLFATQLALPLDQQQRLVRFLHSHTRLDASGMFRCQCHVPWLARKLQAELQTSNNADLASVKICGTKRCT